MVSYWVDMAAGRCVEYVEDLPASVEGWKGAEEKEGWSTALPCESGENL